ncbi:Agamous-like MADS-box protein AGL11 [Taenia solium]|eukprot:TsM_000409300 transcript=TsM_000409300 gene=TsM_000409300
MDQGGKIPKKGRNKIKIAPIANSKARSTTFSKRRFGLFKKAYELSDLTRSHVKILVITDKGCLYEYASPCFESKLKSVKKVVPMMTNERILKRLTSPPPYISSRLSMGSIQNDTSFYPFWNPLKFPPDLYRP